jgi:ferric-dicitrate binding protein FerR (iron transport regulator)
MTTLRTAAESLSAQTGSQASDATRAQIAKWRETADRYDSEPSSGEGRKELAARAKAAEDKRDRSMAAYHQYELASGAVQIAIVLASAAIITGITALTWIAGGLGIVGVAFSLIGLLAPTAVHLF